MIANYENMKVWVNKVKVIFPKQPLKYLMKVNHSNSHVSMAVSITFCILQKIICICYIFLLSTLRFHVVCICVAYSVSMCKIPFVNHNISQKWNQRYFFYSTSPNHHNKKLRIFNRQVNHNYTTFSKKHEIWKFVNVRLTWTWSELLRDFFLWTSLYFQLYLYMIAGLKLCKVHILDEWMCFLT